MDGVYDELDELKAEMEMLKEECRTKQELSEGLRKAHNEQLVKFMEAKSLIEEQVQQLNAKSEEIAEARQICEDLKSSLHEKELSLGHLNFANEKLRAEYGEKIKKMEGENKVLALSLDEATTRTLDWERKICAGNEEIEGLKRLLLIAQKKCLEAEQKAKASEELEKKDNVIGKIEEENRNVQDQLKWKSEQFTHLEEAHERLQDQFQLSKLEWEKEKSELLEEVCSLQTSLDSQTRISESLCSQLKMCNQALSHEESKRKILEVEVFELKSHFENVILECQEAKSKIENLTLRRDEDIAELRNTLGTKESLSKEMEYKISHLELENQELQGSLKECREPQIKNAGGNSLKKLQNKLRCLEQLHSQCSVNLKEKEAEWSSRFEKMTGDINGYISDLKVKEKEIQELQMKLEGCHCLLEVQHEEISVVTMVLKSEFLAIYTKLFNEKVEMEMSNKERDHKILLLREQLETKNSALLEVDADLEQEQEQEQGRFLVKRAESLDYIKYQESFRVVEELERHKKMFDELSNFQVRLEEQVVQLENELKKSSKDVTCALERANCELVKKIHEVNQTKLELQKWKSSVEKVKVYLEENHEVIKQENESLLGIVKEQDEKLGHLQQQIVLLESTVAAKMDAIEGLKQEKETYYLIAENKDCSIEKLQDQITRLKQESAKRELEGAIHARLDAQKTFEEEEERLLKFIKEKDQIIEDLCAQATSLKQNFESAAVSSFSVITEKQIAIDVLNEALEKAENLKELEIQEKNKTIDELEKETNELRRKLKFQEESLLHLQKQVAKLEKAENLRELEIQEKKKTIDELEKETNVLCQRLKFQGESLLHSQKQVTKLEKAENLKELEIQEKKRTIDELEKETNELCQKLKFQEESLLHLQKQVAELEKAENLRELEIQEKKKAIDELEKETNELRQKLKFQEVSLIHSQKQLEKAENLKELEIQEKNKSIDELETKTNELCQKLKFREESLIHSQKQVAKLEAALEAHKSETERLKDQFRSKKGHLEGIVKELQCEKQSMLDDIMKLSAEREDMLVQMEGVCNWISDFSGKDGELMDIFKKILQNSDNKNGHAMDLVSDGLSDSRNKGENTHLSSSTKSFEESIDKRSPLKALNH